jgi:hypothetical protein
LHNGHKVNAAMQKSHRFVSAQLID